VKEHKTLNGVLKQVEWNAGTPAETIFDFFTNPPVEDVEIEKAKLNEEAVKEIMVGQHDFSEERIDSALKKLRERHIVSGLGKFLK
jgi:hypothetical protein